ncbi:MAG: Na+/H+ antiporter NhaA [Gemmatimonadota bacterium]|nr:Na+/H+ antiporter NhaA [Gemmatimonadota bacterium]
MTGAPHEGHEFRDRTAATPRQASFRQFLETEAGGAAVLLTATLIALAWANSPWAASYHRLWATELSIGLGSARLSLDLAHWVNDGLMTLFFLVIGLEVRREFDMGELRERRRAAVPIIAGLVGMFVPALIFLTFNPGGEAARGWAIVMATDTAFALGVLALAGRRLPLRLRIFLLTLVVVDDVGAITIIAFVYSSAVALTWLLVAVALILATLALRQLGVERATPYWVLGVAAWFATLAAGIHPTVAGVALGLLTSAYPPRSAELQRASRLWRAFREQPTPALAREAARRITSAVSPNERLQHELHLMTSFVIVPLFALANAGIELSAEVLRHALTSPLSIGVIVGLVVGKPLGITAGAWLATRRPLGGAPLPVGWPSLIATSSVAGIGFTVSLLIAELSYTGRSLEEAKLGILGASLIAATLGALALRGLAWLPVDWIRRAEARTALPIVDLDDPVELERDHVRGPADASVTLVEYGDYECPHCASAAGVIGDLLERFGGNLRFVFRHIPLSDVHPNANLAAEAAEAAGAQGKFWEMHDVLLARQDHLQLSDLIRYATELGLDVDAFRTDLDASRFAPRVARDVTSAELAGVTGTPTFFINDRRYTGAYDVTSLEAALRHAERDASRGRSPAAALR